MKKVAWSSRAELLGSTAVVIVTVFALAVFIYFADTILIYVFKNGLGLW
jgi:preprotein translocase SecE subunit